MFERADIKNNTAIISGIDRISLIRACACGQAFRWIKEGDGFFGVAGERGVFAQQDDNTLKLFPCTQADLPYWLSYFDLERDYAAIEQLLLDDDELARCVNAASGIRVFNQQPFETLITFIISANNNIKRIAGIVERLCTAAGEKRSVLGKEYFAFPSPTAIAMLSEKDLLALGAGYRAPYIKASAEKVADGYNLDALRDVSLECARKELCTFLGVGPKVADCVLLFSLGYTDAFPIDVWIDRALNELMFDGKRTGKTAQKEKILQLGEYSGIIQQYIFHYIRNKAVE